MVLLNFVATPQSLIILWQQNWLTCEQSGFKETSRRIQGAFGLLCCKHSIFAEVAALETRACTNVSSVSGIVHSMAFQMQFRGRSNCGNFDLYARGRFVHHLASWRDVVKCARASRWGYAHAQKLQAIGGAGYTVLHTSLLTFVH